MPDIKEMTKQMKKRHFDVETDDFMEHIGNVKQAQTVQ